MAFSSSAIASCSDKSGRGARTVTEICRSRHVSGATGAAALRALCSCLPVKTATQAGWALRSTTLGLRELGLNWRMNCRRAPFLDGIELVAVHLGESLDDVESAEVRDPWGCGCARQRWFWLWGYMRLSALCEASLGGRGLVLWVIVDARVACGWYQYAFGDDWV